MKHRPIIDKALAALDANDLRMVVREFLPWLDDAARARLVNALVDRAARGSSGWTPPGPAAGIVPEVETFAAAAVRVGHADPEEVDEYLRQGTHAFLGRDCGTAFAIFRALLRPIGNVDIDLGQHEMLSEVLSVDAADCAAQYVVSIYMTAAPSKRAQAVLAAIDEARAVGHFWQPIREMERVAIEPLPDLPVFLAAWRRQIERFRSRSASERRGEFETEAERWLSEVTQRLEGTDGLARLARKTKRSHDLRTWCSVSLTAHDWPAALNTCDEAAALASEAAVRAEFLDGAALAAQELGRPDLYGRLERAWQADPTLIRLCRWLSFAPTTAALQDHVRRALEACPDRAHRQVALLRALAGDLIAAADLLAAAPGLGWSHDEHPGHLAFWLLARSLAADRTAVALDPPALIDRGVGIVVDDEYDDADAVSIPDESPRLRTPDLRALCDHAHIKPARDAMTRGALMKALRTAAAQRVAGVTNEKRRRHYGHAAQLVMVCLAVDPTPETAAWVADVRATHRRFHALQEEFDSCTKRR